MDNSFDSLLNASAVPQDEKVQAFLAQSKNNRNRCYELSEQVTAQVATDGKMLQKYLDVQSTFDRYATNNALLILAQRPDAQKLGDYGYWRDHGFYLKRMERQNPVLILEPGKTYKGEIDFVAINGRKKCFIQVAYYLAGKETIEREFGAFKPISDASPKYVFSLDRFDYSRNGIAHINIVDFLLGKKDINLS